MLVTLLLLVAAFVGTNCHEEGDCGTNVTYYGTNGTINSPNYPNDYDNNLNCSYSLIIPQLSSVSLTLLDLNMESCCDYVELMCRSHSVSLPMRYTGQASNLNPITFTPCQQITVKMFSDFSVNRRGYSISYLATPIECIGNCTPISNSFGYVCPCDTNQTDVAMPTMAPDPQCPSGCEMRVTPYYYCRCNVQSPSQTTCPFWCSTTYGPSGNPTCNCTRPSYTTTSPCPYGCYRTTDWLGYQYCNCPSSTNRPISCPSGCYQASDFWGNPYCNCPASTQSPNRCAPGCTSAVDVYGNRYCNCPTTTLPPCYSPCYYSWNYTYSFTGIRYCYCPPTTTQPPPTGCNQTLTDSVGIVMSPNYPNAYPRGIDCYQYISVPRASSIRLRLIDMNMYFYSSDVCMYDYVEITGCDGSVTTVCSSYSSYGFPSGGLNFVCTGNSLVTVKFSTYASSYYYNYRGFKFSYTASTSTNCSDSGAYLSKESSGVITSPNYPNNFPLYSECFNYLFADDQSIQIKMVFEMLRLEEGTTCQNVFLKLTCQDNDYSQTICGSKIPPPITIKCSSLQIWFKSNSMTSYDPRSFKLTYFAVQTTPPPGLGSATDLSESAKLGIGLGVGIGGFFLIIVIVIIIILIVNGQRESKRRDQVYMQDLTVICRSMNSSRASDAGGDVRIWGGAPGVAERNPSEGFTNPLATVTEVGEFNPAYKSIEKGFDGSKY